MRVKKIVLKIGERVSVRTIYQNQLKLFRKLLSWQRELSWTLDKRYDIGPKHF